MISNMVPRWFRKGLSISIFGSFLPKMTYLGRKIFRLSNPGWNCPTIVFNENNVFDIYSDINPE